MNVDLRALVFKSIRTIVQYTTLTLKYVLTYNNILTVLLFLSLCAVKNLEDAVKALKEHTVYDIDHVRSRMLSDLNYSYSEGCRNGVQYPSEYSQSQTGFNQHSPTIWCDEKRETTMREWIDKEVYEAGRKSE